MGTRWASTFQSSRRHDRLGSRGHQGNNNITPTVVSGGRTDALAPGEAPGGGRRGSRVEAGAVALAA